MIPPKLTQLYNFLNSRVGYLSACLALGIILLMAQWVVGNDLKASLAKHPHPTLPRTYWVTRPEVTRQSCPSLSCGQLGTVTFLTPVRVEERVKTPDGDWGRISQFTDAQCEGEESLRILRGNTACTEANGIKDGTMAEWVPLRMLTNIRPPNPYGPDNPIPEPRD